MKKRIISLLLMLCMVLSVCPMPAAFADSDVYCTSTYEMAKWIIEHAHPWRDEMVISFSSNLDDFVRDSGNIHDLMTNCGAIDWSVSRSMSNHTVTISDIEYRPGLRLAYAHTSGDDSYVLNDAESFALKSAQNVVKAAKASTKTTLELERYLHDWICMNVDYTSSEGKGTTYYDTCVGVFNGLGAECDGYADAFYLLCKIAGIPVGYQRGETYDSEEQSYGGHLWNVVFVGGSWVHVDITWNDRDVTQGSNYGNGYAYFNVSDVWLQQLDHIWKSECVYYPLSYYMDWNVYFYTCSQNGQKNFGSYFQTLGDAASYARSMQKKGANEYHFMVDGYFSDWDTVHGTLASKGLRGQWFVWYTEIDGYTLYDVYLD